ncbi:hypothetical protein HNQ08_001545 [Deinococcus humi]|uniref:Uncharacterized protein n=1 Tax=Deinococcus humi TaxID=662880 RepID=A0A7W8JSI9_9DEIO|nr:hypothetical protein [Deinococcus humi]
MARRTAFIVQEVVTGSRLYWGCTLLHSRPVRGHDPEAPREFGAMSSVSVRASRATERTSCCGGPQCRPSQDRIGATVAPVSLPAPCGK